MEKNLKELHGLWWQPKDSCYQNKMIVEELFKIIGEDIPNDYCYTDKTFMFTWEHDDYEGNCEVGVLGRIIVDIYFTHHTKSKGLLECNKLADDWLGVQLGLMVTTWDDGTIFRDVAVKLGSLSEGSGGYTHEDDSRYDEYNDEHILVHESIYVETSGDYIHRDTLETHSIVYSENAEEYYCSDDDDVSYGYVSSSNQQDWFCSQETVWCNDECYFDSCVASDHDIVWSDRHDDYVNRSAIGGNAGYHSLSRTFQLTPETKFGIGFEIEKEDEEGHEVDHLPLHDKYGWCKEDDSSLCEDTGFELITPAFDLYTNDLDKAIESSSDLEMLIDGEYTTACGGHITLSSSLYTSNELIEGVGAFFPLLYALYEGRVDNDYSRPKQKWEYHNGRGRNAIRMVGNTTVQGTDGNTFGVIEMRIFSAVRSVRNLLWRRDLVRVMADNVGKSEKDVLRLLTNPKSKLFRHLRKVYSIDQIVHKISSFVSYAQSHNHKVLQMPDRNELKEKLTIQDKNESTNELGA